jgi:hypothetical protein
LSSPSARPLSARVRQLRTVGIVPLRRSAQNATDAHSIVQRTYIVFRSTGQQLAVETSARVTGRGKKESCASAACSSKWSTTRVACDNVNSLRFRNQLERGVVHSRVPQQRLLCDRKPLPPQHRPRAATAATAATYRTTWLTSPCWTCPCPCPCTSGRGDRIPDVNTIDWVQRAVEQRVVPWIHAKDHAQCRVPAPSNISVRFRGSFQGDFLAGGFFYYL